MTPDTNGLLTLEETDPITPFQTTINTLLASFSDRIGPALPDVQHAYGASSTPLVATVWTNIPSISTININFARACWVDVRYSCWAQATPPYDLRLGVNVTGATTSAPQAPAWGTTGYFRENGTGNLKTITSISQKVIRVNAGSNTFAAQGYVSGSTAGAEVNYGILQIIPLRWDQ